MSEETRETQTEQTETNEGPSRAEALAAEFARQEKEAGVSFEPADDFTSSNDGDTLETAETGAETGESTETTLSAPEHWDDDAKKLFATASPDIQQYLIDRNKTVDQAHTKLNDDFKPYKDFSKKYEGYFNQVGAGDTTSRMSTLESQLQLDQTLRFGTAEDKYKAIAELAKGHDIDLRRFGAQKPPDTTSTVKVGEQSFNIDDALTKSPVIRALVQRLQGEEQSRQQAAKDAESRAIAAEQAKVDAFKATKGEDGQPLYPDFDLLESTMAQLAQTDKAAGKQPDYADLYVRARAMHPETSQKAIQERVNAELEAARAKEKEKIAKAKKAGQGVGAGSAPKGKPRTRREALARAWDEQQAA